MCTAINVLVNESCEKNAITAASSTNRQVGTSLLACSTSSCCSLSFDPIHSDQCRPLISAVLLVMVPIIPFLYARHR
jgi:hypothetical protein